MTYTNTLYMGTNSGEDLYLHPNTAEGICLSVISQAEYLPLGVQLRAEDLVYLSQRERMVVMEGLEGVKDTVTPETMIVNPQEQSITFLHGEGETKIQIGDAVWANMHLRFAEALNRKAELCNTPVFAGGIEN